MNSLINSSTSYSDLVLQSDVFSLLDIHSEKLIAVKYSKLKRSTFYDYSKLQPLTNLFQRQKLTRTQCFKALAIIDELKFKYSMPDIERALLEVEFSEDFKFSIISILENSLDTRHTINQVLAEFYDVINIDGHYLPISLKPHSRPRNDIQLLCCSLWSVSTVNQKTLIKILKNLPEDHYLNGANSRNVFIERLYSNLFKTINKEVAYQASELLITTKSAYKEIVLSILIKGWITGE